MNSTLLRDLGAWEAGELASEELLERYGDEAISLAAMHERLSFAALLPGPDADSGWAALQAKLEDAPVAPVVRLRTAPRRRLELVAAAVLMLGGTALAVTGGADEPVLRAIPRAAPDPAGGPGAFRADRERVVDKVKRHPTPEISPTAAEEDDEASSVDSAGQGADGDHQGTHPGKGNDGTDAGKDSDADTEDEPGKEDDAGSEEGKDESQDDEGSDDEGSDDDDGPSPYPGGQQKGGKEAPKGKPESHDKPSH